LILTITLWNIIVVSLVEEFNYTELHQCKKILRTALKQLEGHFKRRNQETKVEGLANLEAQRLLGSVV
jgi:hypothetical protein